MKRSSLLLNPSVRLALLLGALVIVLLVAGYSFWKSSRSVESIDQRRDLPSNVTVGDVVVLDAAIQWSKQEFYITNQSSQIWRQCKFEVNAAGFGDGYGALIQELGSGSRATIAHPLLRTTDGAVYDYTATPPTRSTIRCQDVDGKVGVYVGTSQSR